MPVSLLQLTIQAISLDGLTWKVLTSVLIECGSVGCAMEIHLALVTHVQEGTIISLGKF